MSPPLGFSLIGRGAEAAGDFDATSLSLTGFWRASYGASPWTPTASAGSSASNGNLTEATNPPAEGAAVNDLTPADFDGTDDKLANANAISTFLTGAAWSAWALVWIDAIVYASATTIWSGDAILGDSGAFWGLHLSSAGGNKVYAYNWDGAEKSAAVAITTGAWQLVQAKYDGVNVKIRVNGGSWTSTAAGNLTTLTGTLRMGEADNFLDGKVLEAGLAQTALSDTTFDNVRSYVNARYALSV